MCTNVAMPAPTTAAVCHNATLQPVTASPPHSGPLLNSEEGIIDRRRDKPLAPVPSSNAPTLINTQLRTRRAHVLQRPQRSRGRSQVQHQQVVRSRPTRRACLPSTPHASKSQPRVREAHEHDTGQWRVGTPFTTSIVTHAKAGTWCGVRSAQRTRWSQCSWYTAHHFSSSDSGIARWLG